MSHLHNLRDESNYSFYENVTTPYENSTHGNDSFGCDDQMLLLPFSYKLCIQILLPIICGFGMVGIVLTLIVLSNKNMSTSTNCYLHALAIADLCFLVIMSPKVLETQLTMAQNYMYTVIMIYVQKLLSIFIQASGWLTVILAVERYIAICHPLKARSICSVNRARVFIVLIFFFCCLFRLPEFFLYKLNEGYDHCNDRHFIWYEDSNLGKSQIFRSVYYWADCILTAVLPFTALLCLNGCLIREIRRSTSYLRYHLTSDSNIQKVITNEELRITLMLVSFVVVFFICQAPFVLLHIMKRLNPDTVFQHFHLLTNVTILLLILRSSVNFILYCWLSEKFRHTFKKTFCVAPCCPDSCNTNDQEQMNRKELKDRRSRISGFHMEGTTGSKYLSSYNKQ